MPFPLSFVPKDCFYTGGRRFGADRENGKRKHAACDLIADEGIPIYAIRDGVVELEAGKVFFYHGTTSLAVRAPGRHHRSLLRDQEGSGRTSNGIPRLVGAGHRLRGQNAYPLDVAF